jgi:hypothetical protein
MPPKIRRAKKPSAVAEAADAPSDKTSEARARRKPKKPGLDGEPSAADKAAQRKEARLKKRETTNPGDEPVPEPAPGDEAAAPKKTRRRKPSTAAAAVPDSPVSPTKGGKGGKGSKGGKGARTSATEGGSAKGGKGGSPKGGKGARTSATEGGKGKGKVHDPATKTRRRKPSTVAAPAEDATPAENAPADGEKKGRR